MARTQKRKLKTPFAELVPPLSSAEFQVLKADIEANGIRVPVMIDEDGNILDGHHRYQCDDDPPTVVVSGLRELEKKAFVIKANVARRNLSPDQKKELTRAQQKLCKELKADKKYSQKELAVMLGVSRPCIEQWLKKESSTCRTSDTSITGSKDKSPKKPGTVTDPSTDSRVKVNPKRKSEIAERVDGGESQAQVAADFGISQRQVSNIARAEKKKAEILQQREEASERIQTNCGVIHGDFRKAGAEPESVDMIFTDPPYDKGSATLYADLAQYAATVLVPGGWLLAYSGHANLPDVYKAFSETEGITYAWTFCIVHNDADLRFRKFKLHNAWKPIVAAYKPPLAVSWEWFKDVASGGREKDLHEWQQSEVEAAHFIEPLAPLKAVVCDPFCGSGTTLVAAKRLGRRWIGFELNEEHVLSARMRIDGTQETLRT